MEPVPVLPPLPLSAAGLAAKEARKLAKEAHARRSGSPALQRAYRLHEERQASLRAWAKVHWNTIEKPRVEKEVARRVQAVTQVAKKKVPTAKEIAEKEARMAAHLAMIAECRQARAQRIAKANQLAEERERRVANSRTVLLEMLEADLPLWRETPEELRLRRFRLDPEVMQSFRLQRN